MHKSVAGGVLVAAFAAVMLLVPTISFAQTPTFNTNHQLNDTSADILALQQYLNTHGFVVASSGPGSLGNETSTFGTRTYQALVKFQKAHNLPTTGFFGPLTRASINSFASSGSSSSNTSSSIATTQSSNATAAASTSTPTTASTTSPCIPGWCTLPGYAPGQIIMGGGSNPDVTPPSVSLTAPTSGATVGGSATLTANASDNIGVTNVSFNVDGTSIASVSSAPYTTVWSSAGVADGSHTLTATAKDAAGNTTTSAGVAITVDNTAPVISAIASSSIASTTQTITWTTNEPATSVVSYGLTTSYGSASSSAILTTSHSITLKGLTASTTYYFTVTSADASGNTSTANNQSFTTASYTYYVDSVNGSDSNPGTSPSLAFQNITVLPTVTAGQSVGLACNSHWRQQLTLSSSYLTVQGYPLGCSNPPILDGSDIIPNANFVKTDGYTNVYNTNSTLTFLSHGTNSWINVFETGGPSDNSNGQMLEYVSSVALVDSTVCSYYVNGGQSGGTIPSNATVYIHACDAANLNPATNGYLYEFSNRPYSITNQVAYTNETVRNVETRKAASFDGSMDLNGSDMLVDQSIIRDGTYHEMIVGASSTVTNSRVIDCYVGDNGGCTGLVVYSGVGAGTNSVISNNIFQQDQTLGQNTSVIAHTASGTEGTLTFNNNWYISKNGAYLAGPSINNYAAAVENGDLMSNVASGQYYAAGTLTLNNVQIVTNYLYSTYLKVQNVNSATINLNNSYFCSTANISDNNGAINGYGSNNVALTINGGGAYLTGNVFIGSSGAGNGSGWTVTMNNFIFQSPTSWPEPIVLVGSGNTFVGGLAGNANSYNAVGGVYWKLNNVTYGNLAAWKAAESPQDAAATTAGTIQSTACTLPTIPTVN